MGEKNFETQQPDFGIRLPNKEMGRQEFWNQVQVLLLKYRLDQILREIDNSDFIERLRPAANDTRLLPYLGGLSDFGLRAAEPFEPRGMASQESNGLRSSLLGREYPNTPEGLAQLQADEAAIYGKSIEPIGNYELTDKEKTILAFNDNVDKKIEE